MAKSSDLNSLVSRLLTFLAREEYGQYQRLRAAELYGKNHGCNESKNGPALQATPLFLLDSHTIPEGDKDIKVLRQ